MWQCDLRIGIGLRKVWSVLVDPAILVSPMFQTSKYYPKTLPIFNLFHRLKAACNYLIAPYHLFLFSEHFCSQSSILNGKLVSADDESTECKTVRAGQKCVAKCNEGFSVSTKTCYKSCSLNLLLKTSFISKYTPLE